MQISDLTRFEQSYIEMMLWSETDDDGTPFDNSKYCDVEFSDEALVQIQEDCGKFQSTIRVHLVAFRCNADASEVNSCNLSDNRVAHDFWLTRNRHGAGFWDGDYPQELGEKLTEIAHSFGEQNLYIGDDGRFYL